MLIKDEKGVALVLVLVIVALLVSLLVDFTYTMQVDMTLAANQRDEIKALYTARSGVEIARHTLQEDDTDYDARNEDWALFDEHPGYLSENDEGRFKVVVEDEAAKFPIHSLIDDQGGLVPTRLDQLGRLFVLLDIDLELIDAIVDWLDPDDTVGPSGAEDAYYKGLSPPYPCKNGPLASIEELLLVKGMTGEILYGTEEKKGLIHYLTIYSSEDGKININTASPEVLQSLSDDIDENEAQAIVDYLQEEPFKVINCDDTDIKAIIGGEDACEDLESQCGVKSSVFSLHVEGQVRGIKKGIYTVVKRQGEAVEPIFWRVE